MPGRWRPAFSESRLEAIIIALSWNIPAITGQESNKFTKILAIDSLEREPESLRKERVS
jgi:hypothetical protein